MRVLLSTLSVTVLLFVFLTAGAIATNTNATVYVVNTDGNLGGIPGDMFYNASIYWALQELGMIGPNGEYPHPDPDDPTRLVYTRDDGTKVQVGTIGGEEFAFFWTNGNKQSIYDMQSMNGIDQPWGAVSGGNSTHPGQLIITTHGVTGHGTVGVPVPKANINATGINIGGLTHAGFKSQNNKNSNGTELQSECPNFPGPFPLVPRPNANISVFLNACYSAFDPPGADRRSVSDTLKDVPGVGTVTGYQGVTRKQLQINFNGNAQKFSLAKKALEEAAIDQGFTRVIPGAGGQPAQTHGMFGQMAAMKRASQARSMLQQIVNNANITGVTVTMKVVKTPPPLRALEDSWDYYLPPFVTSDEMENHFIYNPHPRSSPVVGNINATTLEPCGNFQVVPFSLEGRVDEILLNGHMPAAPAITVLSTHTDGPVPCNLFFQVPHNVVISGVIDVTDDALIPLTPLLSPQGIGAATTTDRVLVPIAVNTQCPSDLDGNGVTNVDDLLQLLACFGSNDPNAILEGDINGDLTVDVNDVLVLLSAWDDCPWPEDSGACCTNHDCWFTLPEVCLSAGGDWQGKGSDCKSADCTYGEPVGACCYYDDDGSVKCLETTVTECESFGRPHLGLRCHEIECPGSFGACCVPSDAGIECFDLVTPAECSSTGGQYQGPDTWCDDQPCPLDAACCIDGVCFEDLSEDQCAAAGGTFHKEVPCDEELCSTALENDECEGAIFVKSGFHVFDTTEATTGPPLDDFANCNPTDPMVRKDVWYAIDIPDFSFGAISTCAMAGFDTRLAIYHGTCDGNLQMIACNDDFEFCPDGTSDIFCDFLPGTMYIRIGGASDSDGGSGTFRIEVFKGQ